MASSLLVSPSLIRNEFVEWLNRNSVAESMVN